MVESGSDEQEALSIAGWAVERFGAPVVLVTPDPHRAGLAAMRAGVRDMITPDSTVDEYRDVIARNRWAAQSPSIDERRGRVITVASPKGGVGKTTVTTNLAVGLSQLAPESVVLVDLDIHFGDVASALNLLPEYALPDAARAAGGDPLAVKPYLTRHETGLWVVAGSDSPAAADEVTATGVTDLLRSLVQSFSYVVVDTAPGLSEHTLAALDLTDILVLVTGLDVPGVRGLRKEIDTLAQLSLPLEARHIVLNFADAARGLTTADVESTIQAPVDHVLPSSKMVPISVNQGIPLLQSRTKDPVTRQLQQLVERISGQQENKIRRGFFGTRGRKESA
ncbi:pilus assembly protein CpaE [Tessaracoccus oleiagri]|uniref:Pilus assembly protein CpaE n=2 Tax=Tessaracoccus oleiagri TaxID=686624 RepID=A0A1G9JVA2_9ACTN|nr:pilus assembly protein CpaE [Tessaracoccus oleiagri]